jgi:hypothetical protein
VAEHVGAVLEVDGDGKSTIEIDGGGRSTVVGCPWVSRGRRWQRCGVGLGLDMTSRRLEPRRSGGGRWHNEGNNSVKFWISARVCGWAGRMGDNGALIYDGQ